MKLIKNQPLMSTHTDKHNENFSKEDLEIIFNEIKNKSFPLGQDHDPLKKNIGYFENARLIQDKDNPENYFIIADVYCDPTKLQSTLGGFSFSGIKTLASNDKNPIFGIYLPYPYYNNPEYIKNILKIKIPIQVGKWVKKKIDPTTIVLITTIITVIFGPFWKQFYDKKIAPNIDKLLESDKLDDNLNYDVSITCEDEFGRRFKAFFIVHSSSLKSIRSYIIKAGLSKVYNFLEKSDSAKSKGIAQVYLRYVKKYSRYDIFKIIFKDGSFEKIGVTLTNRLA